MYSSDFIILKQGEDKNNCIATRGISILLNIRTREWSVALKSLGTEFSTNIYGFDYLFPEQTHRVILPGVWAQVASGAYTAPVTLRHNLPFHWGCRGTVSSKHPNQMCFSSDTLKDNCASPTCDLKICFSEGKVWLVRAKWWCG